MCSHHAGSVQVLGLLRVTVERQERVGVACRAVTQAVALLQQAEAPHHLPTLPGVVQVLRRSESLQRPRKRGRGERVLP